MAHSLLDYRPQLESFAADGPVIRSTSPDQGELEFASALLEVSAPSQLAKLVARLQMRAGLSPASPVGRALMAILATAARRALPTLERALAGKLGSASGNNVVAAAGRYFGLELEGLSPEDQEFEAARRFVSFANNAIQAAKVAPGANAQVVAQAAVVRAARRYAPGLLTPPAGREPAGPGVGLQARKAGRWVRQGHHIIVDNC